MVFSSTRSSLLIAVKDAGDGAAWRRFEGRYGELMRRYCVRLGLQLACAEDVCQGVMIELGRALPGFRYDRSRGSFRGYLGLTLRRAVSRHRRRLGRGPQLLVEADRVGEPAADAADTRWEDEWVQHHYRRALSTLRETHDACSLEVFDHLLGGASIPAAATASGLREDAVRQIKRRVKTRLAELISAQLAEEDAS